jgi:hypothetical protein
MGCDLVQQKIPKIRPGGLELLYAQEPVAFASQFHLGIVPDSFREQLSRSSERDPHVLVFVNA